MCSRIQEVFGVEVLPVILVTLLFIGLILSYTISVGFGTAYPLCPTISNTGSLPPGSGVLTITLIICAVILSMIVVIRYKEMKVFHTSSRKIACLNTFTLVAGAATCLGVLGVASFRLSGARSTHVIATILTFSSMLALSISIATITITVYRCHNKGVRGCVLAQVIFLAILAPFLLAGIGFVIAYIMYHHSAHNHHYYTPYSLRCGLAVCEWGVIVIISLFLLTLHEDLKKLKVNLVLLPRDMELSGSYESMN